MKTNITINPKKNTLFAARDALAKAIAGIDKAHAITRDELIGRIDTAHERITLKNAVKRMCTEATVLGAFGATVARRYFDIRTLNATCANSQTEAEATPSGSPAPQAMTTAPATTAVLEKKPANTAPPVDIDQVEFSVYSDGRLAIIDGDEILVIPPDATRRLGYFLGCFEKNAWPPRLDPHTIPA